jgi:hypothetical protein
MTEAVETAVTSSLRREELQYVSLQQFSEAALEVFESHLFFCRNLSEYSQ